MVILIPILIALLGVLLLWRGRRGVVIDDHPLCRRCGFDLTGRPHDVNICSECGTDLTLPNAVRVGHRRPRHRLIIAGVALMLIGLLPLGAIIVGATGAIDWQSHKPTWWLLREFDSPNTVT